MPRAARRLIDGGTYHVLTRGNNGQMVFHHEADYQRYLRILSGCLKAHQMRLHHFALMPNHVHLILRVPIGTTLSTVMQRLNLTYTLYYRKRYRYAGYLWQGRFKSLLIDRESYLLECGRYVELNPVRAGLTDDPGAYPWSSYQVYAEGRPNPLVHPNPLYHVLGRTENERRLRYQQFIRDGIRQRTHAQLIGSASPVDSENPLDVFASRRRRGRPRRLAVATDEK